MATHGINKGACHFDVASDMSGVISVCFDVAKLCTEEACLAY